MKALQVAILALIMPLLYGEISAWTSVNGQSIEAEIVGFYGPFVYLEKEKSKGTYRFPYSQLEASSKKRASQWLTRHVLDTQKDIRVAASESKLTRFLSDNLMKQENGKLVPYEFASRTEPEFYAFYFSARWCGSCRKFTPDLVAFYKAMKLLEYENF